MAKADLLLDFLRMVRPALQQADIAATALLVGTGLSKRMRTVLEVLAHGGSQTVPDLARYLGMTRQSVQSMVNETHVAGLTERRDNPRHRRSNLIVLTEKGAALITEVLTQERMLMAEVADRLDIQDIDTAQSIAQHCHSAFSRLNKGTMP